MGHKTMKRNETTILNDLRNVYCALEPENLYCDGEISASAARKKAVPLRRKLKTLLSELGRNVTEAEIWGL